MAQPILLLNCGSSSIKYQLIDPNEDGPRAVGIVQRIGLETSTIDHEVGGREFHEDTRFADHVEGVAAVVKMFNEHGPSLDDVVAVGHRTVHGGLTFIESTLITEEVIDKLVELSGLAPLHNPPGIAGIRAAQEVLPNVPHVGVFDTAFFSTLPDEASTYAIDKELAEKYSIRRYGFHGTSHSFVSKEAAKFLGKPLEDTKIIVCHLGNGASISAVDGGVAVDTSMGLTPLQGLVMGTRSGDVDPGLHAFLTNTAGMSMAEIDDLLNKRSGLLGLCGLTDMRDVKAAWLAGDPDATRALGVYVHRLVSYIGAYYAILGGLDAVVFTAGVGENADPIRKLVIERLGHIGLKIDDQLNETRAKGARSISAADATVETLVIPTNEELAMARETLAVISR